LDQAKSDYEVAKANFKADDAAINNIKVQIDYAKIKSPISGRSGSISITVGNEIKTNDAVLVTINQMKPIRIQASVPQKYLEIMHEKIKSGIKITVLFEDKKTASGKLEYIDNNIDLASGSFVVKALFANEDEKLWPGMFVNLVVNLGDEKQVVTIPEVAVQHGQKGNFVFVIKNNKAEKRSVTIDRIWNNIAVVTDGIRDDEVVAIDGIMFLKDGSAVSYNQ
jgi:multidrug efflux system membrane fusion protein